jgi:hypothetical protein
MQQLFPARFLLLRYPMSVRGVWWMSQEWFEIRWRRTIDWKWSRCAPTHRSNSVSVWYNSDIHWQVSGVCWFSLGDHSCDPFELERPRRGLGGRSKPSICEVWRLRWYRKCRHPASVLFPIGHFKTSCACRLFTWEVKFTTPDVSDDYVVNYVSVQWRWCIAAVDMNSWTLSVSYSEKNRLWNVVLCYRIPDDGRSPEIQW